MSTAIWLSIIGGVTSVLVACIPVMVSWINRRLAKREDDCKKELAEMREEYKKAIQLAIEQSRK